MVKRDKKMAAVIAFGLLVFFPNLIVAYRG